MGNLLRSKEATWTAACHDRSEIEICRARSLQSIQLQLRSTTRAGVTDALVHFDLDLQTYDFLRELSAVRCILVVLVQPDDETQWLSQSLEELLIRECAFWYSLRGMGPTTATSSIRIAVPRSQVFSVQEVRAILNRLGQGGEA
jgi:hypothetical protein